jgi:hypothetical protein
MDSRRMNLAVVSRALQRQATLYKWIWGIEVRPDVAMLRLVGRSVRRARGGVILKSTTNKGGLL